jgi:hypothetical protein
MFPGQNQSSRWEGAKMLELKDIKDLHDKAYQAGQTTRERAADDLVFHFVTQWDEGILEDSQLAYRGEFNILRKATRQILSDLALNKIQIDFEPVDEDRTDAGDTIDGLYRFSDNNNVAQESYSNAKQEAVVCGFGAWLLETKYVSMRSGNEKQKICRCPINEANNTVFWDPNAKLLDKSDADYCGILEAYTEDGYKQLVENLTGEEPENVNPGNFSHPETSYVFPWIGSDNQKIYVIKFFHREVVKDKILTMIDPLGDTMQVLESRLDKVMDDMISGGWSIQDSKKIERYEVTQYIASGEDILSTEVIVGEHIPVVPEYGERAIIEGEEHYEGITKLAKDPQRLRNFQLSFLADIVSQSPREKPIFQQEQVATFEDMYSTTGSDNNFPYVLQNRKAADGTDLPLGPVGMLPAPNMPAPLIASIELSRQAVEDVANPGTPQDIADPDISGKAVLALQARLDMQSMIYQENFKHAKRRDAEIFVSMATEIYDVPRREKIQLPDGTIKNIEIMKAVVDEESGEIVTINDINNKEFEVYSKITTSYTTQKEQTLDRITEMIAQLEPQDPVRKALQLKQLALMDGIDFDDIRDYANKQLVITGIRKPETDEEKAMMAQIAQAGNQPDPNMLLAQAEMLKGQADMLREQQNSIKMQYDQANNEAKNQISAFAAETDRMEAQVRAEQAGVDIDMKNIEAFGKQLDNRKKIVELQGA